MDEREWIIARRSVIRRLGLSREALDRLEDLQIVVPVRRPGRERAYCRADYEQLRVYRLLLEELDVNSAGAEIILRMRNRLIAVQRRLAQFLSVASEQGLLDELNELLRSLEDDVW
ncbi:MAG: hypothetical protein JXR96_29105 [Deltaproteobacteria bacterium]|nr:hypothetical protein [Deltaproteobacteria bacterium]